MSVCKGCGGSYDNNFQFCPYCGRETPKAPTSEIIIKEAVPVNACPVCQRNDRAEKVSVIYKGGRRETSMSVPVTNIETDSNGRTYSSTSYETVGGLSQTKLSEELAPPAEPLLKQSMGLFSIFGLVAVCGILPYFIGTYNFNLPESIYWIIFFVLWFGISILIYRYMKKEENKEKLEYNTVLFPAWERAMETWKSLYFCHRDGVVFIPGKNWSVSLERLEDIYK
ncbi:MAG: hypothetical protein WCP19_04965 [Chloroflexota bacterium]